MRRSAVILAALVGAAVLLVFVASYRSVSLAGDPFAVYFPVAQNLARGFGLGSFAPLAFGPGRHPGYPMLLALASVVTPDLIRAAQIVGVASALVALSILLRVVVEIGGPARAALATTLLCVTNWVFVRASIEALPDMAFMAATTAAMALLGVWPGSRRAAFAAGIACGVASLIRPNAPVLVVAGLASIALTGREAKLGRMAAFGAGAAVGFLPFLAPVIGLRSVGIRYPVVGTANLFEIAAGETVTSALVRLSVAGLLDLPHRLAATVGTPVALVGLPTLAISAWRGAPIARAALLFFAVMTTGLLPFHYEGRYYLFAIVILAPACALGLETIFTILLRARWSAVVAWTSFIAGMVAGQAPNTRAQLVSEQALGRAIEAACDRLEEIADPPGSVVLAGAGPGLYAYSRFRECPRPTIAPTRSILIDALPDDQGLDAFFRGAAAPQPKGDTKIEIASQSLVALDRAWATNTATTTASSPAITGWSLTFPRAKACEHRTLDLAPGVHDLEATFETDLPLAARLTLTTASRSLHVVGAGTNRPPVHAKIEVGTDGKLDLQLCASDPLRAPGRVTLRSLIIR